MVKGITRQVILVKSPDPKLFEEAIFIVKEEALAREGVSADQVLRQARQAADGYLKGSRAWDRRLGRFAGLAGPFWGAAGALLVWGDRIFEKCGIRRDEGGDGGKTLEIRGKRRLSARDGGANYQQS